ncbi:hypothetical protein [Crocosphaera sp.]|uniref:hypothetical protein n=1 Tax=Crocosphaera sp. TaxID=2729996 RepID=UPI00262A2871|nr:hypothetical protein [Crocosphaera sp.]MDJ0583057.1 hypothetical protein [Crocosphaera sp.]
MNSPHYSFNQRIPAYPRAVNYAQHLDKILYKGYHNELNDEYFEILVVKDTIKDQSCGLQPYTIETELKLETKYHFKNHNKYPVIEYDIQTDSWKNNKTIGDFLPTTGVRVDHKFIEHLADKHQIEAELADFSTVRYLLQGRKISQLLTKTWLDLKEVKQGWERDRLSYIKQLVLSHNLAVDEPKRIETLFDKLKSEDKRTYVITPEMRNYNGIRLSLLLAGQAYKYVEENEYGDNPEGYVLINESLLSSYEIALEYIFKVSWDTFSSSIAEIQQPGLNQRGPYLDVTLGYPPRPSLGSQTTLTQNKLQAWADAEESSGDFRFYPPYSDGKYQSETIEYVMPPYPYLPGSTAC